MSSPSRPETAAPERTSHRTSRRPAARKTCPNVLDALTVHIREGLSESPASIQKFDIPIAQATTSSFEALKAFSLGEHTRVSATTRRQSSSSNAPSNWIRRSRLAMRSSEAPISRCAKPELGKAYYQKAFELRDRTSENEKLRISAVYYERVGNSQKRFAATGFGRRPIPRIGSPGPICRICWWAWPDTPSQSQPGREALRLNPAHYGPYSVLARAYKRATRFADAKAIGRLAGRQRFGQLGHAWHPVRNRLRRRRRRHDGRAGRQGKGHAHRTLDVGLRSVGRCDCGAAQAIAHAIREGDSETARSRARIHAEEAAIFLDD